MILLDIFGVLTVFLFPSNALAFSPESEADSEVNGAPGVFFPAFPTYKKPDFNCPAASGRFPHESDCSRYYECIFGLPHLMRCDRDMLYDERKRQCEDAGRTACHDRDRHDDSDRGKSGRNDRDRNDGKDRDRDRDRDHRRDRDRDWLDNKDRDHDNRDRHDKNNRDRDRDNKKDRNRDHDRDHKKKDDKDKFKCPHTWGAFAHPTDCSKYYLCFYNEPSIMQCNAWQLYDVQSRKCRDRRRVNCGDRLDKEEAKTTKQPITTRSTTISFKEATTTENPIGPGRHNCPFPNGRFPDPADCSQYIECRRKVAKAYRCPKSTLYDERREECLPDTHVRCGDRPGGLDEDLDSGENKMEPLRCPYTWGTFPHRYDCSKYIICVYNVPKVYSCRRSELFHARYRRCYPKEHVKCDKRTNPDKTKPPVRRTTKSHVTRSTRSQTRSTRPQTRSTRYWSTQSTPSSSTSTPEIPYTSTTSTPETTLTTTTTPETTPTTTTTPETTPTTTITPETTPTTTTTPETTPTTTTTPETTPTTTTTPETTPTTTTTPETTPTTTTSPFSSPATVSTETTPTRSTPQELTTTEITAITKPNTPPPVDCDEDDLDCIIDGTGDVKGWFDCPERYGHFAHGSSRQLFIHCDNFKPFVKKCADGTVFSPEYLVCTWQ